MRIYQVTDTHVSTDPNAPATRNFATQMAWIGDNPADLLVISGDLAEEEGSEAIYELMAGYLPEDQPTAIIPGNHDDPLMLWNIFGERHCHDPSFFYQFPLDDIDLVFANSASGALPGDQLRTIAKVRPGSVLFVHHPTRVLSPGGFMDTNYPLADLDQVHQALKDSPVKHVFCGHFHCEHHVDDGYELHVTPSAAFSIDLSAPDFSRTEDVVPVRVINIDGSDCRTGIEYLAN